MTLPHPRWVTVGGRDYPYILKDGKGRLHETSAATIRLTVEIGKNRYFRGLFLSKAWTKEHAENLDCAPHHKASFKPSDVVAVIQSLEEGEISKDFELPEWKYVGT